MGRKKVPIITQSPSLTTSIRRSLSSNDFDDGLSTVANKKKQKNQPITTTDQSSHDCQTMETSVLSDLVPAEPVNDQTFSQPESTTVQQAIPALSTQPIQFVQPFSVTNDSTRYALSRFPFPPFLIRFNSNNVLPSHIEEDLIKFCEQSFQTDIQILNCRPSRSKINGQEHDFLLYLKDSLSFSFLLDMNHWPSSIKKQNFSLPSLPHIPPQLSLIIKHVDLDIDFDEFCANIKSHYPDIKNVVRMKNKFQNYIRMVKIELTSCVTRDKLLNEKKILVNYVYYPVDEYLAPFQVLICSKCSGIGHFRNACTQVKSTCKICCELVDNPDQHKCSNQVKCAHCGANHKSTSSVCPIVKTYRAELTRIILQPVQNSHSVNHSTNPNPMFDWMNFSQQQVSQPAANTDMMNKLDNLIGKIADVKDHLTNLSLKYELFEKVIEEKNQSDQILKQTLNQVSESTKKFSDDVIHFRSKVVRQESIIIRVLIPMFTELLPTFISQMSNTLDGTSYSNMKQNMDRYLVQMQRIRDGKHFLS